MSTEAHPTPVSDPIQTAAATSPRQPNDDDVSNTASPSRAAPASTIAQGAPPARPVSPPNQMTDPVSALQAMFPSMDRTIITEVLAAHGGNPDSASMALLELSDSTPATANSAGNAGAHTANAQMLADEAYARELMAQMEREHMNEYGRPLGSAPHAARQDQQQQSIDYSRLNYTPRQQQHHQSQGQGQHVPSSGRGGAGSRTGLDQMVGQQQGQDAQHGDGRPKYQDELDQLTVQLEKFADSELGLPRGSTLRDSSAPLSA